MCLSRAATSISADLPSGKAPAYFIEIAFEAGGVAAIRDFFHVPYIAQEASFELDRTV